MCRVKPPFPNALTNREGKGWRCGSRDDPGRRGANPIEKITLGYGPGVGPKRQRWHEELPYCCVIACPPLLESPPSSCSEAHGVYVKKAENPKQKPDSTHDGQINEEGETEYYIWLWDFWQTKEKRQHGEFCGSSYEKGGWGPLFFLVLNYKLDFSKASSYR